jgi:hypothetical protein
MTRLIAIGDRGTAFAELDDQQLRQVKVNGMNPLFKEERRTPEQKAKRDRNEHQGDLRGDTRAWISSERGQGEFWLGTIERALQEQRVWKALGTYEEESKLVQATGYIRADFRGGAPHSRKHKVIAVDTHHGRVESVPVKRESGEGLRNSVVWRNVLRIEPTQGD